MGEPQFHTPLTFEQAIARTVPQQSHDTFINLVLGDCRDKMQEIERESVHLVVTDPPYYLDGLGTDWRKGKRGKRGTGTVGGLPVGMKFDPEQGKQLYRFMMVVAPLMYEVLKPGGFACVFSQPRLVHRMACAFEDADFEIRDIYAWHFTNRAQAKAFSMDHFVNRRDVSETEKKRMKRELRGRKTPQLRPQFESIILAQKPRDGTFLDNYLAHNVGLVDTSVSLDGKMPSTVMQVDKSRKSSGNHHLTVKPVHLIEHLIRLFCEPGQIVLDPFLGSGTTAIAALRSNRACIGIEINPEYLSIAEERLKEF